MDFELSRMGLWVCANISITEALGISKAQYCATGPKGGPVANKAIAAKVLQVKGSRPKLSNFVVLRFNF